VGIPIINPNLWRLISPALPVGAFQYSQGLEQAIANGWVNDTTTALNWIESLLRNSLQNVDLPILKLAYTSWVERDNAALEQVNAVCLACRETSELRSEEVTMGLTLGHTLRELGEALPDKPLGFVATFAIATANQNIPVEEASAGYAWSWCENQVLNAVKLVPLGHIQGQKMLRSLGEKISEVVQNAQNVTEEDIGRSAFGATIASSQHETLNARLYRS